MAMGVLTLCVLFPGLALNMLIFCFWVGAYCSVFFFFSSRRRHTRCSRDWSSDVCSSDLPAAVRLRRLEEEFGDSLVLEHRAFPLRPAPDPTASFKGTYREQAWLRCGEKIGRASCRERV